MTTLFKERLREIRERREMSVTRLAAEIGRLGVPNRDDLVFFAWAVAKVDRHLPCPVPCFVDRGAHQVLVKAATEL